MNKQNNNEFPVSGRTGYPVSRFPSSRTSCRPNIRQNQFPLEPNTSYCWAFPTQRFTEYSFKLDIWSKIFQLIHKTGYPPHNITYITVNIYYFDHICPPKKLFTVQKATLYITHWIVFFSSYFLNTILLSYQKVHSGDHYR